MAWELTVLTGCRYSRSLRCRLFCSRKKNMCTKVNWTTGTVLQKKWAFQYWRKYFLKLMYLCRYLYLFLSFCMMSIGTHPELSWTGYFIIHFLYLHINIILTKILSAKTVLIFYQKAALSFNYEILFFFSFLTPLFQLFYTVTPSHFAPLYAVSGLTLFYHHRILKQIASGGFFHFFLNNWSKSPRRDL